MNSIAPQPTSHGCGMKRVLVSNGDVSSPVTQIAVTSLVKGERAERHSHPTMDEFFLVRRGSIRITVGEDTEVFGADGFVSTAVPTILLNNCINYCKSDCYERKIARWISESDFVL